MPNFTTQQSIDIAGIKDGAVILKSGGYRLIMSVSTINFALKSEQEQNSLIFQYQSFLNSLHFPIEIVMRSKKLDLTPYLQKIINISKKQENELLKIQTDDYIEFVDKLINLANIMKKSFYVVIPHQPVTLKNVSFIDKLFKKEKMVAELRISEEEFKRNYGELTQKAEVVAGGLGRIGLHCVQLNTEEIIELFYQIYNPEIAGKERITDANLLSSEVIEHASEKPAQENSTVKKKEESVVDNTADVQATIKEQASLRQQEMLKEGERQIGMHPAEKPPQQHPTAPAKTETPAENPAPASTAANPAPSSDQDQQTNK